MLFKAYNHFILQSWLPKVVFDFVNLKYTDQMDDIVLNMLYVISKQIQLLIKHDDELKGGDELNDDGDDNDHDNKDEQNFRNLDTKDFNQIFKFLKLIAQKNDLKLNKKTAAIIWNYIPSLCSLDGPTTMKSNETKVYNLTLAHQSDERNIIYSTLPLSLELNLNENNNNNHNNNNNQVILTSPINETSEPVFEYTHQFIQDSRSKHIELNITIGGKTISGCPFYIEIESSSSNSLNKDTEENVATSIKRKSIIETFRERISK